MVFKKMDQKIDIYMYQQKTEISRKFFLFLGFSRFPGNQKVRDIANPKHNLNRKTKFKFEKNSGNETGKIFEVNLHKHLQACSCVYENLKLPASAR